MSKNEEKSPALIIEYTDAEEDFQGWLVIDSLNHNLCAGGMRVQQGLTRDRLTRMARNMTYKMKISGLRVDGAKCGIDYDPASSGKYAAMARFMTAISPYIKNRYSMGPDMNVEMDRLESIGRELGLTSVKMAVATAQGWELPFFSERYRILNQEIDGWPLSRIRLGYGVGVATLTTLDHLSIPYEQASVAIQGFGNLARAAAFSLNRRGIRIMALTDAEKSIVSNSSQGLNIRHLLEADGPLLPKNNYGEGMRALDREAIFDIPVDILIPGAMEKVITAQIAERLRVKAVVPGANLAVTSEAEKILYRRKILTLPDFLAGCGGSLFMEGLFGPKDHPKPETILDHVEKRMRQMIKQTLARSLSEQISPTAAANHICAEFVPKPGTRPYGALH